MPESLTLSIPSPLSADIESGGSQTLTYGVYDFLDNTLTPFSITGWASPCVMTTGLGYQFILECIGGFVLKLSWYLWQGTFIPDDPEFPDVGHFDNTCTGFISGQCFISQATVGAGTFSCNPFNADFPTTTDGNFWPSNGGGDCSFFVDVTNGSYTLTITE